MSREDLSNLQTRINPDGAMIAFLLGDHSVTKNGVIVDTGIIGAFMEAGSKRLDSVLVEPARALGINGLYFEDISDPPLNCSSQKLVVGGDSVTQYLVCRFLANPKNWRHDQQSGNARFTLPAYSDLNFEDCKTAFARLGLKSWAEEETAGYQVAIDLGNFDRLKGILPSLKPENTSIIDAVNLLGMMGKAMHFCR